MKNEERAKYATQPRWLIGLAMVAILCGAVIVYPELGHRRVICEAGEQDTPCIPLDRTHCPSGWSMDDVQRDGNGRWYIVCLPDHEQEEDATEV